MVMKQSWVASGPQDASGVGGELAEVLTFRCWLSVALEEGKWSDAPRNSLAFISATSPDQRISILRGLLGWGSGDFSPSMPMESEIPCLEFPTTILEAIKEVLDKTCTRCGTLPEEPALCLACRELLCIGCFKCRGTSECTAHAKQCRFRGRGLFLMPFSGSVALVTPRRSGLWPAPYVDSRGETDHGLRRTVRLNLDVGRAEKLKLMVLRGTMDVEIIREVDKSGTFVPALL